MFRYLWKIRKTKLLQVMENTMTRGYFDVALILLITEDRSHVGSVATVHFVKKAPKPAGADDGDDD